MRDSNALSRISTSNLADAHDHLGLVCKWLSRDLVPTRRDPFWGAADVVQWGPARKTGDIRARSASTWDEVKAFVGDLERGGPAKVYVAGCKEPSRDYVLVGGMSLTYLGALGYRGAVINGTIRDHEEVAALAMPVWSSGYGVMDSQGCMKVEARGSRCTVNGHAVEQGDLVMGDGNGVVAVSAGDVDAVVARASAIAEIEARILERVRAGENLFDLVSAGGHI